MSELMLTPPSDPTPTPTQTPAPTSPRSRRARARQPAADAGLTQMLAAPAPEQARMLALTPADNAHRRRA